jgi:hypothetical protein
MFALLAASAVWAQSDSPGRVVRLSFVEGSVTVQRPDVQAWAEAPVNTPLQAGFKLSTGENSYAEIQFENGGTIRLGELALLDLTALELTPQGSKVNHVDLRQGYATFHLLASNRGNSLQVVTPDATLNAQDGARFRVDMDQGLERVEVFDGAVNVQSNLGDMTLEKDSVLGMQPGSSDPTVVSQGITKDDWDQWVDDRESRADEQSAGPSPSDYEGGADEGTYGWSDLAQYGHWSNVPGAGIGWIPALNADGWSPYSTGQWCWYPGWGYTWIGAEPWGWLPYHFGGWEFVAGRGWMWFPGSFWMWAPSQVVWYHGPNWVGWVPRPYRKDGATACGDHCGGGVVSTETFRQGGLLTSHRMLGISPTSGERVKAPGIIPTTTAKLPGPAVSSPAALTRSFRGNTPHVAVGANNQSTPTTGTSHPAVRTGVANTTTSGPAHVTVVTPNSAIVFDPERERYINGPHVSTTPASPTSLPAGRPLTAPSANHGPYQPVPVGSHDSVARPLENHEALPPTPAGNPFVRQAPPAPRSDAPVTRPAGSVSPPGGSHVGGGSPPAPSHPTPPPAGGGHPGAAPGGHR